MSFAVPTMADLERMARDDPMTRALPPEHGADIRLPDDLTCVLIVFTHRNGSFYLANLLATSGFFNEAQEDLSGGAILGGCERDGFASLAEYFCAVAEKGARNGHFVVKLTIGELNLLAWHGVLARILPRCRFIVLERMDTLAQAISWSIADQTGRYYALDWLPPSDVVPVYDFGDLSRRLERVRRDRALADLFMAAFGVVPLHLTYEELIAEPENCARQVCDFLGHPEVTCDASLVPLRRQATALNAEWRARFVAEQAGTAQSL